MSFTLTRERPNVTFDMTTGQEISFEAGKATCVLDIHSNTSINLGEHGLRSLERHGNFSKWVSLDVNEGVAVTGLDSCGAVFVASKDFSSVAAAHLSGDARFVPGWIHEVLVGGVKPHYILWGIGGAGNAQSSGRILLDYMDRFKVQQSCARTVVSCGAIFLVRTQRGVAYAQHNGQLACVRTGQAVRVERTLTDLDLMVNRYPQLKTFNSAETSDQFMLLQTIAGWIVYDGVPKSFPNEQAMERVIAAHGKNVTNGYLATLTPAFRSDFLTYEIFKAHPDWKPRGS